MYVLNIVCHFVAQHIIGNGTRAARPHRDFDSQSTSFWILHAR
jgi:hypothetical protein